MAARRLRRGLLVLLAGGLTACAVPAQPTGPAAMEPLLRERFGDKPVAVLRALQLLLQVQQGRPEAQQVEAVNQFFNRRIQFEEDSTVWGRVDHWATPLETIGQGKGDCEDYVIAKYYSLRQLGVPPQRLALVYVRAMRSLPEDDFRGPPLVEAHMVLSYFSDGGPTEAGALYLDNLDAKLRSPLQRPDLTPVFSFQPEGVWQEPGHRPAGAASRLPRWVDVQQRAQAEGWPH